MAAWQVILLLFLVILPMTLLADMHPHRERLDAQGRPLPRDWRPPAPPEPPDDEEH